MIRKALIRLKKLVTTDFSCLHVPRKSALLASRRRFKPKPSLRAHLDVKRNVACTHACTYVVTFMIIVTYLLSYIILAAISQTRASEGAVAPSGGGRWPLGEGSQPTCWRDAATTMPRSVGRSVKNGPCGMGLRGRGLHGRGLHEGV